MYYLRWAGTDEESKDAAAKREEIVLRNVLRLNLRLSDDHHRWFTILSRHPLNPG